MAEDVDPVDQPVSVEVIDSLADMDLALEGGRRRARFGGAARPSVALTEAVRSAPVTPGWSVFELVDVVTKAAQ